MTLDLARFRKGVDPGDYSRHEMPMRDYHRGPGISSSGLKAVSDSVATYLDTLSEDTDTAATIIGTAIHDAILEPEIFAKTYHPVEPFPRLTEPVKKAIAAVAPEGSAYLRCASMDGSNGALYRVSGDTLEKSDEAGDGKILLDSTLLVEIVQLADAVIDHPVAGPIISHEHTEHETSYYAHDPITGLLCKARIDIFPETQFVVDLKTARSASWEAFRSTVFSFGYARSAAFYMDVVEWSTGTRPRGFAWLVADKRARRPESIALYAPDELFLEEARQQNREALNKLAAWVETAERDGVENAWSGYDPEFQAVTLNRRDR